MNFIISKIFIDYLKKIKNITKKNIAFDNYFFFKYIKKKEIKNFGIKKIITFSKKVKKNFGNNVKFLEINKKIDYFFCYCKNINKSYFFKGKSGLITKEKILYNNSKKIILFTESIKKKINNIPLEIIPSLKKYIIEKINFLCNGSYIKKNKKNFFYSEDNLNIIIINYITNYNLFILEKKILNIFGVIKTGIYHIKKNISIILIKKKKIFFLK
ncbi:ribose-5-phosphate isomerase A [Candidatus Vidania fulgoroideorum]